MKAAKEEGVQINEFTVAPFIKGQGDGKSFHEWFVEFENRPADMHAFAKKVDSNLRAKNIYYDDLISGNILAAPANTPREEKWVYRLYEINR